MNKPKTNSWLWIILIIVILGAAGFFGWRYWSGKNTASTVATLSPSPSISADFSAVDNDLNKLDDNFNQLDKIDPSEDNTPSL